MSKYINFHTHTAPPFKQDNELSIVNISQKEWSDFDFDRTDENTFFSTGLHPWYLTKENFSTDFEKLTQHIAHKKVIIIGECGLDALKGENLTYQIETFAAQIELAESIQKPIVVHCVKAYNELIALKKRMKPSVPMIVHGFDQNGTILLQLLKNGFYISLGSKILRGGSNADKALQKIPLDHLFFENDDKNIPIIDIYSHAASTLAIDLSLLRKQICDNFKRILTPQSSY